MKLAVIAVGFAAVVAASPWPWAAPQASISPTPKANRTRKGNHTHHHHKEATPTFKQSCDCPKPIVPINLLSENERCLMEHAAAMGCYIGSKGGCPSPAPACGLGVLDAIPYTH